MMLSSRLSTPSSNRLITCFGMLALLTGHAAAELTGKEANGTRVLFNMNRATKSQEDQPPKSSTTGHGADQPKPSAPPLHLMGQRRRRLVDRLAVLQQRFN